MWSILLLYIYSFIVDFQPLKVELTKEIMHPIQCEAFKQCLISQEIERFEELLIVNGCDASYSCFL